MKELERRNTAHISDIKAQFQGEKEKLEQNLEEAQKQLQEHLATIASLS